MGVWGLGVGVWGLRGFEFCSNFEVWSWRLGLREWRCGPHFSRREVSSNSDLGVGFEFCSNFEVWSWRLGLREWRCGAHFSRRDVSSNSDLGVGVWGFRGFTFFLEF